MGLPHRDERNNWGCRANGDFGKSMAVREVVLVGLGRQQKYGPDAVRRAYGAGARAARDIGAMTIAAALPPAAGSVTPEIGVQAATEGALLSLYQFSRYHTLDAPARAVDSVTFVGAEAAQTAEAADSVWRWHMGSMVARDLATEPGNALVPADLAAAGRKIAAENGMTYTEYDVEELTKMGAGALLAVGQGSANPPFLVHLTYEPAGGYTRTVAVIGKGITFDTGGISLKPSQNMEAMKHDMGGAATTLGVMAAVAQVAPKVRVFGIIATAENMPSDTAFRPGDVLTAMNGKTIEVISTDAEGRLVLADALVYAARNGADAMIDLATLTGGAVVALGTSPRRYSPTMTRSVKSFSPQRQPRARRRGGCRSIPSTAIRSRAMSQISRTPVGAKQVRLLPRSFSKSSRRASRGCISILRERCGIRRATPLPPVAQQVYTSAPCYEC